MRAVYIVVVNVVSPKIVVSHKYPVIVVAIVVGVDTRIYSISGAHRLPSVVAIGMSPVHPRRAPFVIRYPEPTVKRIVIPSPIMERRPPPIVIRHPGPAIPGVNPITIG